MFRLHQTHRARLRATVLVEYPACWFSALIKRAQQSSRAHPLCSFPTRAPWAALQSLSVGGVDSPNL